MLSNTVHLGAAIALLAAVLLARYAKESRARIALVVLAVAGVVVVKAGYLRIVREDQREHEALMKERKRMCESVALHMFDTQGQIHGASRPSLAEQRAGFYALGGEIPATWRTRVRADSPCGSMSPGLPIDPTDDVLGILRNCFEQGPTSLESARAFDKD